MDAMLAESSMGIPINLPVIPEKPANKQKNKHIQKNQVVLLSPSAACKLNCIDTETTLFPLKEPHS